MLYSGDELYPDDVTSGPATDDVPDIDQLSEWIMDGIAEAMDGCTVEPDGTCEHGAPSWLIRLGMI